MFKNDAFEQLEKRGFVFQTTNMEVLKKILKEGPITFYIGIDPTADCLHIGHFFGLQMARILQDCGHRCIVLVGGATGLIGDPSGKKDMRKVLTEQDVAKNASDIKDLLKKFIVLDGENPAIIVDNADWLRNKSYIDFLREVGVHFNVNEMLRNDLYKKRLEEGGLTFMEMGYMLLQAYDFVHLNDKYDCVLEIGGSDQWGNIVAGTQLSRKMNFKDGTARPTMVGLTCPLLTNAEGQKMGKTEKGALWLNPEKTSPYEFYQYWRNVNDSDVINCFNMLTFMPTEEIKKFENLEGSEINKAKEILAFEITKLVHGEEEAQKAMNAARALFSQGAESADMPKFKLSKDMLEGNEIPVLNLLTLSSISSSKSDARRLIKQGGITIDGNKITDENLLINVKDLEKGIVIKKGKKMFKKVSA